MNYVSFHLYLPFVLNQQKRAKNNCFTVFKVINRKGAGQERRGRLKWEDSREEKELIQVSAEIVS